MRPVAPALVVSLCSLAACPSPRGPSAPAIAPHTIEIGRDGAMLTGVAAMPAMMFAALTLSESSSPAPVASADHAKPGDAKPGDAKVAGAAAGTTRRPRAVIEARGVDRSDAIAWRAELDGYSGPLVASRGRVVGALGGTRAVAGLDLRGEPGAALVALDAATGAVAWKLAVDATDWVVIASLTATPDGVVAGGSFVGTLRIADRVVGSGGKTDGFVASVTAAGAVRWLIRLGGPGADAVQGVAAAGDRVAIAGTFTAGADLLGQALAPYDDRSPAADGFVAELDASGARRWVQTFGGKADEAIAGVAIDAAGRVAVAATVRDTVHIAGADHVANGLGDGLVAWWSPGGSGSAVTLLGGSDFDGLRAITAIGERIVVAGFFSGALRLGDRALTAGGGDDAFLAALDPSGSVVTSWPVTGPGREEVTALSGVPGGFIAGVSHTATASVDDAALPAPRDSMSGAALVVRGIR
jgi:hypothetical protein